MSPKSSARVAAVLFQYRLWREGKLEEYWNRRAECKAKGATFGTEATTTASKKATAVRKDFGWLGPRNEFEREKEHQFRPLINKRKEMMAEYARNKGRSALDKAFDDLPDSVPYQQEVAWVRAHPLVFAAVDKASRDEEYKPAKLTVRDITSRSNGPAPSKGAATELRFALSDPLGWHKKFMDGGKKKAAEGSGGKAGESEGDGLIVNDDLSEIRQMISSIGTAAPENA